MSLPLISVNGVSGASISPLDRGFAYGDGLFETCRCIAGRIPLWSFHRERLLNSAMRLQIPLDEPRLNEYLDKLLANELLHQIKDCVVKIQITRGAGGRGYRLPDQVNPTYCISIFSAAPLESAQFLDGTNVRVCDLRLGKNAALAGLKHLNRLEQILARAEWRDEFAEGLLFDTDGNLIEATASNVFLVKNGQLFTPDLTEAGVAGVMRRAIIEVLAPRLKLPVNVGFIKVDDLMDADEVFLSNGVLGIWPVNQVAGFSNKFAPSITRQLQQALLGLMSGNV